jgi:hypothetical protein
VLVGVLGPFCRSCKKLLRNDCSAAVPDWPEAAELVGAAVVPAAAAVLGAAVVAEAVLPAAVDAPLLLADVDEVVPPKSVISLENAVFSAATVLADTPEDEPAAAVVALTSSLSLKSLTKEVSAAMRPCCAYCAIALLLPDVAGAVPVVAGAVAVAVAAAAVDADAVAADVVAAGAVAVDAVAVDALVPPAVVEVDVLAVVAGAGAGAGATSGARSPRPEGGRRSPRCASEPPAWRSALNRSCKKACRS